MLCFYILELFLILCYVIHSTMYIFCVSIHVYYHAHFNCAPRKLVIPAECLNCKVDLLLHMFICYTDMWHVNKILLLLNLHMLVFKYALILYWMDGSLVIVCWFSWFWTGPLESKTDWTKSPKSVVTDIKSLLDSLSYMLLEDIYTAT